MKALACAATLAAVIGGSPAFAEDPVMRRISNTLTEVPCSDLVRIVLDQEVQNATEGQVRLAAMSMIVGRALAKDPKGEDMAAAIDREKTRMRLECLDYPGKSWMIGILAMQMN